MDPLDLLLRQTSRSVGAKGRLGMPSLGELIGRTGVSEIRRLAERLGRPLPADVSHRFAPSLVARGEAELLGTSASRFAVRLHLSGAGGFVNLRHRTALMERIRLGKGRRRQGKGWVPWTEDKRTLEEQPWDDHRKGRVTREFVGASVIADSLLRPPESISREFRVLEAELGPVYGEQAIRSGTPYMRHVDVTGGGLCAQAACFMASALLHDVAAIADPEHMLKVHGLVEITALATDAAQRCNELLLDGLSWWQIVQYFRSTHWSAFYHDPIPHRWQAHDSVFDSCVRSYVLSGFPVILPVAADLFRQASGESTDDSFAPSRRLDHAVLIVGCSRDAAKADLLVNDPSTWPFIPVPAATLRQCAASGDASRRRPAHPIAVVPRRVKLPLEQVVQLSAPRSIERISGLEAMHRAYWGEPYIRADAPAYDQARLWRLADMPIKAREDPAFRKAARELAQIADDCRTHGWGDRWAWVLHNHNMPAHGDVISIWNAEVEPQDARGVAPSRSPRDERQQYGEQLIAYSINGNWKRRWSAGNDRSVRQEPVAGPSPSALRPALISSFSTGGFREALKSWPKKCPCDLFAFMPEDLRFLDKELGGGILNDPEDVTRSLATLWRTDLARSTAERISTIFRRRNIDLVAVTSYVPEISCLPSEAAPDDQASAVDALCFLMEFAHRLRTDQKQDELRVLEMVAGSMTADIWPGRLTTTGDGSESDVYVANRYNRKTMLKQLAASLHRVVAKVRKRLGGTPPDIRLALELEPGPLFVLNSMDAMENLCGILRQPPYQESLQCVHFNLDVAHWALADIDPAEALRRISFHASAAEAEKSKAAADAGNLEVLARVAHAHISAHGHGHFGDAVIGEAGLGGRSAPTADLSAFEPWIALLGELSRRSTAYDGYVSLELEACERTDGVRTALTNVRRLLA